MMIAGTATLMPSDRLSCEEEGRLLCIIKKHYFYLTNKHAYTGTHVANMCTGTGKRKRMPIRLVWVGEL